LITIWFIIKCVVWLPFRLLFWTRVINKKELRKHRGKGVVFCCNHRSYTDGPLLFILFFWRKKRFLVKPEMFSTKFKNVNMRALGCYPVERGKDLSLIKYTVGNLKKNRAIIMFPEGMRAFNPVDALALRNGAAMIAIKAGVPIVPMVLKRAPRPFVFNALKVGTAISTEEYQGRRLEKSDLAEISGKIQVSMTKLLNGFEVKKKPKWWETQESVISRGVVIKNAECRKQNAELKPHILVLKRVRDGQEYYTLPGGHVDKGEAARDAAIREVLEETGISTTPVRLLYKTKFKELESFYLCAYKSGDVGATDAPEYTDPDRNLGTYEPMLLPLDELKKVDLRPNCVRDQLIKDIEKYGVNLPRSQKYVK